MEVLSVLPEAQHVTEDKLLSNADKSYWSTTWPHQQLTHSIIHSYIIHFVVPVTLISCMIADDGSWGHISLVGSEWTVQRAFTTDNLSLRRHCTDVWLITVMCDHLLLVFLRFIFSGVTELQDLDSQLGEYTLFYCTKEITDPRLRASEMWLPLDCWLWEKELLLPELCGYSDTFNCRHC